MNKLCIALFMILMTLPAFSREVTTNDEAVTSDGLVTQESLTLQGRYAIGVGGIYDEWKVLYINGNRVKKDLEVIVELDLQGAVLTYWEFNPNSGNGTVYINDINLDSGTIRFTPRSGDVISFRYRLEKDGMVKDDACSFRIY